MTNEFVHAASEHQAIIPNQFEFKEPPPHKFLLYPLGLAIQLNLNPNDALLHAYLIDCKEWALSPNNHKKHLNVDSNGEVFATADTRVILKCCGFSKSTFYRSRKRLLEVGLLQDVKKVPNGHNMVNAYYVLSIEEFLKKSHHEKVVL